MREQNPIDRYREEDLKTSLSGAMLINLFLGIVLLMPTPAEWATNYSAWLCIVTGIVFFLIARYYDWQNNVLNITFALIYLGTLIYEYTVLGFPSSDSLLDTENYQVSKGFLMDIFLYAMPMVYTLIRIVLIVPLLLMIRWKKQ